MRVLDIDLPFTFQHIAAIAPTHQSERNRGDTRFGIYTGDIDQ